MLPEWNQFIVGGDRRRTKPKRDKSGTIEQQCIGEIDVSLVAGLVDMPQCRNSRRPLLQRARNRHQGVIVDLGAVDFLALGRHGHPGSRRGTSRRPPAQFRRRTRPARVEPATRPRGHRDIVGLHATLDEALAALTA